MSGYTSMLQEVVEGLSRRGHSIEDRGPDWVLVEDENGRRFKISVGEQVEGSTPIASPAPATEPAPVPPPVDALATTIREWAAFGGYHTGFPKVTEAINALWAAGVAEGRRLLDETAATAAAHAYELGIAEGRRQATEERTEEKIRIDVSLDSPEYRRQLLKMIRNGQIVVRGGDHG